jgi:hypothetical protein
MGYEKAASYKKVQSRLAKTTVDKLLQAVKCI